MGLIALALAPGITICLFIYLKDKYNKEPLWMLLLAFFLGVLSIIPAFIVEYAFGSDIVVIQGQGAWAVAFFTFCIVAGSEEASKFLMLRLFVYPRKHFDDPFDGIMYAVMVGMGFATIENVFYVYQNGYGNGIARMFLAVPAHGTFAVMMGYFVGLAKFKAVGKLFYFLLALLLPILFHGAYDFFLFVGTNEWIFLGAIVSLILALFLSFKAIRRKQRWSKLYHEEKNKIQDGGQPTLL